LDTNFMHGFAQPEDRFPSANPEDAIAGTERSPVGAVSDRSNGCGKLEETELDSALQLLVERAQYITGATGTALALPQGEEMVCRASAGSCAPAVGARLQVRSGLTGESITRRQLLRCDNAETDPRVNLEACRTLGIASIVVLPLLRPNGQVRGLFELLSDHPYAFEERDLIALERMADLTLTALDLAEQQQSSAPVPVPRQEPEKPIESPAESSAPQVPATPIHPEFAAPAAPSAEPLEASSSPLPTAPELLPTLEPPPAPAPLSVPEAMLRVQKCVSCGFPVSEGRSLCLDCEKKDNDKGNFEQKQPLKAQGAQSNSEPDSGTPVQEEFVPAFLANSAPVQDSWLANHVNLLAIVVLVLGILVTVVVFR
jgi:putative methionine-R-sulfoxide reductase with GAF domain